MGREEVPSDGQSVSVIANLENRRDDHRQSVASEWAWRILGVVFCLVAIILILWLIGRWRRQNGSSSPPAATCPEGSPGEAELNSIGKTDGNRSDGKYTHVRGSLVVDDDLVVLGQLGTRHVSGHGERIHISDRCRFARGYEVACHAITHQKFRLRLPGIYTCRNNAGATVEFPPASSLPGAEILIDNGTGQPSILVTVFGTSHFQQPGLQQWTVVQCSRFVSNGFDTWMVWDGSTPI